MKKITWIVLLVLFWFGGMASMGVLYDNNIMMSPKRLSWLTCPPPPGVVAYGIPFFGRLLPVPAQDFDVLIDRGELNKRLKVDRKIEKKYRKIYDDWMSSFKKH